MYQSFSSASKLFQPVGTHLSNLGTLRNSFLTCCHLFIKLCFFTIALYIIHPVTVTGCMMFNEMYNDTWWCSLIRTWKHFVNNERIWKSVFYLSPVWSWGPGNARSTGTQWDQPPVWKKQTKNLKTAFNLINLVQGRHLLFKLKYLSNCQ